MADELQISAGVSQVYEHREAFFAIALTGRTGSGCSTVAKILASESFDDIELPNTPTPPRNHEDRKDRIVFNWLKEHWMAFQTIQVSQIILLFALSKSLEEFLDFVRRLAPNANFEKLKEILSPNYDLHAQTFYAIHEIRGASDASVIRASEHLLISLPAISGEIRSVLDTGSEKLYTRVFQALGDNVRRSGDALSDAIDPQGLLALPSAIARIIKLLRLKNRIKGIARHYFAIDALRHPFEIRYLRERISPFYSVAVSTDEISRRARLIDRGFGKDSIEEFDAKEYPSEVKDPKKRQEGYSAFVSQDIQACLSSVLSR